MAQNSVVLNTKRIKSRVKIDYNEVVESMLQCVSVTYTFKYLIKELIQLQVYILQLLIDKIKSSEDEE